MHHPLKSYIRFIHIVIGVCNVYVCVHNHMCFWFLFKTGSGVTMQYILPSMKFAVQNRLAL